VRHQALQGKATGLTEIAERGYRVELLVACTAARCAQHPLQAGWRTAAGAPVSSAPRLTIKLPMKGSPSPESPMVLHALLFQAEPRKQCRETRTGGTKRLAAPAMPVTPSVHGCRTLLFPSVLASIAHRAQQRSAPLVHSTV
jgi:hypothetical protein